MAANNNPTTEVLAGLVERVTFHNEDNGFCVLRVKARGKREPITVVGHAAVISAGESIQASGEWNNDRTHGVQFRARFLKTMPPTTKRNRKISRLRVDPWHWSCLCQQTCRGLRQPSVRRHRSRAASAAGSCRHWTEARRWDRYGLGRAAGH